VSLGLAPVLAAEGFVLGVHNNDMDYARVILDGKAYPQGGVAIVDSIELKGDISLFLPNPVNDTTRLQAIGPDRLNFFSNVELSCQHHWITEVQNAR
jgi:hypothetical protein